MSATPFMQLYVGDYLADTLHLTTEQHGAYLLLLMTMWRADASLPNDPVKLARIARVSTKRWPSVWSEIAPFFVVDGDKITNPRLTKEHQKAVSISQERRNAGKKGGEANALKSKASGEANASDLPKHSQKSEPDTTSVVAARDATPVGSQQDQTDREKLLAAMGADPTSGMIGPNGTRLGTMNDMAEARKWADLGLSLDDQCRLISERMAQQRGRNPSFTPRSFGYFSGAMSDFAARKSAPLPVSQANKPDDKAAKVARWERIAKGAA